jgi:two-component system response regulator HydG
VVLPPLRDRVEDIPVLVKHFCSKATNPHFDSNLIEFTDDALSVLQTYHWPGNLSELQQLVVKIAATTEMHASSPPNNCPCAFVRSGNGRIWRISSRDSKKQYVERVIHALGGDRAAAAKVLGVDVASLT